MLKVGDQVICYVDAIEEWKTFKIMRIEPGQRYVLKGVDTETQLCRVLDNSIPDKAFIYQKI